MSVRLGTFYGELRGDTPLARIEYALRLGIGTVDIGLASLLQDKSELSAAYTQGLLSASSIIIVLNDLNTGKVTEANVLSDIDKAMDLSREFGYPGIIVADYFGKNTPGLLSVDRRREILKNLIRTSLAKRQDPSIVFLVEPMTRRDSSTFPNVESSVAFIKEMNTPQVKMLYDTYHMAADGYDCLTVLKSYVDIIGHIHLSDYDGENQTCSRPMPGGGKIDFEPVVRFLMGQPRLQTWVTEGAQLGPDGLADSLNYLIRLMR